MILTEIHRLTQKKQLTNTMMELKVHHLTKKIVSNTNNIRHSQTHIRDNIFCVCDDILGLTTKV